MEQTLRDAHVSRRDEGLGMSTVLHPVGPNPPRVYWVRRLAVLVGILLVIAVVGVVGWALTFRGGAAGAAGAGSVAGVDAEKAGGSKAAASATPVDCTAAEVQLAVVSDATQYASGANPVLKVSVTNGGARPCTVDAGDAARELVVSSGNDRIWSTKDCAGGETASRQLLLDAGARDSVDIPWARVRSAEGCPANLPAPRTGTYQVAVTLLGAGSAPAVFTLE